MQDTNFLKQQAFVELFNISKSFEGKKVLTDIELTLFHKEHALFTGPNGSGKSTLLKIIAGELFPDNPKNLKKQILWHTKEETSDSPIIAKRHIALVSYSQLEHVLQQAWRLDGEQLILTGIYNTPLLYRNPTKKQRAEAQEVAKNLGLSHLLSKKIAKIRPKELFLLLFARAIIRKPAVLLLDELTDNFTEEEHKKVFTALTELAKNTSLIAASHRVDSLPPCFVHHYTLDEGLLTKKDSLLENQDEKAQAIYLETKSLAKKFEKKSTDKPLLLELEKASVIIDEKAVLQKLSWQMRAGEQWLISGNAGSGKSLFLRTLAGELPVALGGLFKRFAALDPAILQQKSSQKTQSEILSLRKEWANHIHFVSDSLQVSYPYALNGLELVASGLHNTIGLYKKVTEEEYELAQKSLLRFGIAYLENRTLSTMSTGQKRRLVLARAFVAKPSLLLCDDPFTGLDVAFRDILQDMFQERTRLGLHTIVSSRDGQNIPEFISHLCILEKGRIVEQGFLT